MTSATPIFISISLVSNRPAELRALLDNFEQTAHTPEQIEIIVGIDDGDEAMQTLVREEQKTRRLRVKFLSKPYTGFLHLYKLFDEMHYTLCDPNAYFVQHIFDELRQTTLHWDKILKERYVGLFEDDIYRLRLSIYKLWNYHSIEECGPHPDNAPIVTKKWIDLTGWCPCHSADSFQQMLVYFLGKADDAGHRFYRDVPIFDINMQGLQAGVGVETPEAIKDYNDRATEAWRILLSDEMQMQAQKKANVLRAHITGHRLGVKDLVITHEPRATKVADAATGKEIARFPLVPPPAKPQPAPANLSQDHYLVGRAAPLCIRTLRLLHRVGRFGKRAIKGILPA